MARCDDITYHNAYVLTEQFDMARLIINSIVLAILLVSCVWVFIVKYTLKKPLFVIAIWALNFISSVGAVVSAAYFVKFDTD